MPSFSITSPAAGSAQRVQPMLAVVTVAVTDMSGGLNTGYNAKCTDISSGMSGPTTNLANNPPGSTSWSGPVQVPSPIPTTLPPQPNNKTVTVQAMQGLTPGDMLQVSFYAYSSGLLAKPPSRPPTAPLASTGATGSSTTRPKSAKPKAAKPKATKPKPTRPKAAKPKSAKPKSAKAKAAKSKAKPKAAKAKSAKKPAAKKGKKKK